MGSSLSKELFQDASSLEELAMEEQDVGEEGWREWPLLALDGDMAALVELVSEDKVLGKIHYKSILIALH